MNGCYVTFANLEESKKCCCWLATNKSAWLCEKTQRNKVQFPEYSAVLGNLLQDLLHRSHCEKSLREERKKEEDNTIIAITKNAWQDINSVSVIGTFSVDSLWKKQYLQYTEAVGRSVWATFDSNTCQQLGSLVLLSIDVLPLLMWL